MQTFHNFNIHFLKFCLFQLYRLTYWTRYSKEPRKTLRNSNAIQGDLSDLSQSKEDIESASTENPQELQEAQEAPLVENQTTNSNQETPQSNGKTIEENPVDGFIIDNDSEEEINDTEQLIPTSVVKSSAAKHRFKIYEGSEESLNFKKPERHVKLKRFMYWFLGVATFDGKPVAMETQEEREQEMQKKLNVSKCSNAFIIFNWILVIAAHLFLYVLYWWYKYKEM